MPEMLPYATHDFLIDEEFYYIILDHMNTGSDRVIMRDKLRHSVWQRRTFGSFDQTFQVTKSWGI